MKKGYKYPRFECQFCGATVADNHYIYHMRKNHPIIDGKRTYPALPNEKPLPAPRPKARKVPRRAFFYSVVEYIRRSRPRHLPPPCILHGIRAAGLPSTLIAAWYGVSRQDIFEVLKYNSNHRSLLYTKVIARKRSLIRPYQVDGHIEWRVTNDTAYPPQAVIDQWRRQGMEPAEIARRCERFAGD